MYSCFQLHYIGVWDHFRLGGLRSVARIFYPLLARKLSGFARILHEFLLEYGYLKNSRGGGAGADPPPPPASYAYAPLRLGIWNAALEM